MAPQKMVRQFVAKNRVTDTLGTRRPKVKSLTPFRVSDIQEDDVKNRWNPGLQGNRKWGPKYRGAANYGKGRGRPD